MNEKLIQELDEAEQKAWDNLSRYKFNMFGYWAAIWVHLNRISGENRANPFKELVKLARYSAAAGAGASKRDAGVVGVEGG